MTAAASSPAAPAARAAAPPTVSRMVEDIVGCKWSLAVLGAVRRGVQRPGALEHSIEGLSKKVLNERLAKLVRFGILAKTSYAELPPRVEYALTPFGSKFCGLLDGVEALQREVERNVRHNGEPDVDSTVERKVDPAGGAVPGRRR